MTPTQTRVSALCAEILGLARIDLDDNFFEIGSDSHQAVLVALEIETVFGVSLPLEVMESTATARALAAWVDEQQARQATSGGIAPSQEDADG